jgi:branched-chain amino acid transport system substrate-binding protein
VGDGACACSLPGEGDSLQKKEGIIMQESKSGGIWLMWGILFVLVGLLVGSPVPVEAKDSLKIGGTVAKSGRFASDVKPWPQLMNAWADMVNERGGLMVKGLNKRIPVQFVLYDDKSDASTVVKFYERLVTVDKVDLLIGPYTSPLTFPATTIANKHRMPMVCAEATASAIYTRGFKTIVGVDQPAPLWSFNYFELIKNKTDAARVALLGEDITLFTEIMIGAKDLAEKAGLEVVFDEKASKDTKDFTPIIVKMKAANPDVVFVGGFIPFNIAFLKQAKELDFNPKEFHFTHHGISFLEALGKDAHYVTGESYWHHGMELGNYQEFERVLKSANVNILEYPWAVPRFLAMDVIRRGIEAAPSLRPKDLIGTIKALQFEGITGWMKFDKNGQGKNRPVVDQIMDGKYRFAWPAKEGYPRSHYQYPRPKWSKIK